jgi:hypothetical protein
MPIHEAPNDGMVSVGICTRCQRDLIQEGDVLGCPECGEKVSISNLHAALRLKIDRSRPVPKATSSAGVGTTARATNPSGMAWGQTGAVRFPFAKKSPIGSFVELLNELRRNERK